MRVDWAILCRYVEVNNGLATIVGGGIDRYTVPGFPSPLQVVVAVRLLGLPDDIEHTVSIHVLGPMMEPVGTAPPPVSFTLDQVPTDFPQGWEANVMIPVVLNVQIEVAGAYTIDINVDGHSHTQTFRVLGP